MNIAIFETEHFEGAFPVIKLFDVPGNEITVITSPETFTRFDHLFHAGMKRYRWQVLASKGKPAFFFSLWKAIRKSNADIIYLNTISNNHLLYALVISLSRRGRVVLTVHDVNCLFESRRGNSLRSAIIHTGKRWLIRKVDIFNVVADTLVEYLSGKTPKPVSVIPGAVYESRASAQVIAGELRIVIPGSLDKRRRDYEFVFILAEQLNRQGIHSELVLLGGYNDEYGASVIKKASDFAAGACRITCYDSRVVDQQIFDSRMDVCHFVLIPSVVHTRICGDIPETYGVTKSSGNIFDVIKHAKPFFAPRTLCVPSSLESSCIKYDTAGDIISRLRSYLDMPATYAAIISEAEKNSSEFTMEKIRQRNPIIFSKA